MREQGQRAREKAARRMARRGPHSRRRAPHPIKSNTDTPLNYADVAGGSDAAIAAGSLPAREFEP